MTDKRVIRLHESIERRAAAQGAESLPFWATVLDPLSFTRTVERCFDLAFLVTSGKVRVSRRADDGEAVLAVERPHSGGTAERNKEQRSLSTAVVRMDFAKYKVGRFPAQRRIGPLSSGADANRRRRNFCKSTGTPAWRRRRKTRLTFRIHKDDNR